MVQIRLREPQRALGTSAAKRCIKWHVSAFAFCFVPFVWRAVSAPFKASSHIVYRHSEDNTVKSSLLIYTIVLKVNTCIRSRNLWK